MADRVLVVEDDDTVRMLLRVMLVDEGLTVVEARNGDAAIERVDVEPFDLVLLDVRLPGVNGFDVCRHIRRRSNVPVIMVTAQDDSHDVVAGLEIGADDYVTKPFNDRELMARIRAQLRRRAGDMRPADRLELGPVTVVPDEGRVVVAGEEVSLTRTEFRLLVYLATTPNRVFSRDELLSAVWGYDYPGDGRVVDTHVTRLRAKIEADPSAPRVVVTVRGLGYKGVK